MKYVRDVQKRPQTCLLVAERWARGDASDTELSEARTASHAYAASAASAAAAAAYAAAYASAIASAASAASAAASAAYSAASAASASADASRSARSESLKVSADAVRAIFTAEDIRLAVESM